MKKDYNSSPGKRNIENQLASRKGLARKKATQLPTVAESDPNEGAESGASSGFSPDIFDQVENEADNQPYRRPPVHEGREDWSYGSRSGTACASQNVNIVHGGLIGPLDSQTNSFIQNQNPPVVRSVPDAASLFGRLHQAQAPAVSVNPQPRPAEDQLSQNNRPAVARTVSEPIVTTGSVSGRGEGSGSTTAPPPPPPLPHPAVAAPIPAAQRCLPVGPTGLESPASSATTEILSTTVKGPFSPDLEEEVSLEDEGQVHDPQMDDTLVKSLGKSQIEELLEEDDDMEVVPEQPAAESTSRQAGQDLNNTLSMHWEAPPPFLPNPDLLAHGTGAADVELAGSRQPAQPVAQYQPV